METNVSMTTYVGHEHSVTSHRVFIKYQWQDIELTDGAKYLDHSHNHLYEDLGWKMGDQFKPIGLRGRESYLISHFHQGINPVWKLYLLSRLSLDKI